MSFNKFLLLVALFNHNISLSQEYFRYSVENQSGDKTNYVKEELSSPSSFSIDFERVNDLNEKEFSGQITVIQNNPVYGRITEYDLRVFKETKSYEVYYTLINGNVNGLHYVGGLDFDTRKHNNTKNFVAVIDNNIVGSSYTNSSRRTNRKSNLEAKFSVTYRKWKGVALEKPYYTFSSPDTFEEEDLYYDLELMVTIFVNDFVSYVEHFSNALKRDGFGKNNSLKEYLNKLNSLKELIKNNKTYSVFEELEDQTIGKAFGINDNENIIIKVDPSKWLDSSPQNKWYILYHELGHDVLNLRHGQGGRMMFNYPTKNYTWEDFFNDRHNMFIYFIQKLYPKYDNIFMPFPDN
tara:strand:+ start:1326 stop:2378 length:1053 start_codon:yes stop_codon:yes gene_type:complete